MNRLQIYLLALFVVVLAAASWLYQGEKVAPGMYVVLAAGAAMLLSPILLWKKKSPPKDD